MIDMGAIIGILIGGAWGVVMFHYMGIFEEIYYLVVDMP